MAFNLSRNTVVYISTVTSGFGVTNTFEVPVLDGYTFSQDTASETVGLNEAGETPVRGQKIFNTALNPAEVSFTTYIRPYLATADHTCIERILWEAIVGVPGATPLGTNTESDTTSFRADFENSDVHELGKLYIYFKLDNTVYKVSEVQISTAEVDFSIDGISQITWTGKGTTLVKDNAPIDDPWVAGVDYFAVPAAADGKFIKNKLSTLQLTDNGSTITAGVQTATYTAALANTSLHTMNGTATYTTDITVDGGTLQTISINSAVAPWNTTSDTVEHVIAEMNDQIDGANIGISEDGKLVVTSQSQGTTSVILLGDHATDGLLGSGTNSTGIASDHVTTDAAVDGVGTGKVYNIPITGGSLTVENNITFLTPEELGVVNTPIGSFTGTRAVSGSMTAYLRTGGSETGGLLDDLLAALDVVTTDFKAVITAGGSSNAINAAFTLNHAHLVIPSTQVDSVISTTIDFTGLGQDLEFADELLVEYKAT